MNKNERAKLAQLTIEISRRGWYFVGAERVAFNNEKISEVWTKDHLEILVQKEPVKNNYLKVVSETCNESTVDTVLALQRMNINGKLVGVLNFASAYNPGGGFINGSMAQEEALAYASDLYYQQQGSPYYEINKKEKSKCYTDTAIYSRVTFFRDSDFNLVSIPYAVNVVTCPAVNMTALRNKGANLAVAEKVMYERMQKVLCLFVEKGCSTIVLGAWGCGVFGNNPKTIADNWHRLLCEEGYSKYFERIIFSVLDNGKSNNFVIFKNIAKGFR